MLTNQIVSDTKTIIKNQNATEIGTSVESIALAWLSCGLDPDRSYFYRHNCNLNERKSK